MVETGSIQRISKRTDAADVATAAYDQLFTVLSDLSPADWTAATECPGWDVSDTVGHLIGEAKANASLKENLRQQLWGLRHRREYRGNPLDATNALQIADHAVLSHEQRLDVLKELSTAAIRGRRRLPAPMRWISVPLSAGGSAAEGMPRSVNLGQLVDVVYTRDVWMHTIDILRAIGRVPALNEALTRRIAEDVVSEWAGRHGQPVDLTLTGPGGGRYTAGNGGEILELDVVEFCRIVSGRAPGTGLLATRVLF